MGARSGSLVFEDSKLSHMTFKSLGFTMAQEIVEVYVAEQQRKAPDRPVAKRYYAEYVRLPATED